MHKTEMIEAETSLSAKELPVLTQSYQNKEKMTKIYSNFCL